MLEFSIFSRLRREYVKSWDLVGGVQPCWGLVALQMMDEGVWTAVPSPALPVAETFEGECLIVSSPDDEDAREGKPVGLINMPNHTGEGRVGARDGTQPSSAQFQCYIMMPKV